MTSNHHGPFTIHELVDTIRGHWQIAGVDVGDVERAIEQSPNESPTLLKRTRQHLDRMVYACLQRSIRGKCSPRIDDALDELQMAATSLADAWSSIGDVALNGKRTVRQLGLAIDRVSSAFDEVQRLTEQVDHQSPSKASGNEKPLTENDSGLLEAMLSLNATSASPASREQILRVAKWDSEGKHAFDRLKKYGYVDALKGVGFYLTESGIVAAKKLGART